jgi:negative regulator of flagellin synthesis FlgM
MIVKIDKSSSSVPLAPNVEAKVRAAIAKPEDNAPATASTGTSVNLGKTSAQLRSLESGVASSPVNASKVAEIKQAIAEGRFQVNAGAVANNLIKSVTDLLSSQKA